MHICVGNLTIIGSDNGLAPDWRQSIIWTNAGILLIWPWGTNFSEILIEILIFSFKKIHLKVLSAKWWSFCLSLNELTMSLIYDGHDSCVPGTNEAPFHLVHHDAAIKLNGFSQDAPDRVCIKDGFHENTRLKCKNYVEFITWVDNTVRFTFLL